MTLSSVIDSKARVAETSSDGSPKAKPSTIAAILEYAYSEKDAKRLEFDPETFRDRELFISPVAAEAESRRLDELASADPLLSVPPKLLVAISEYGARDDVRKRLLELMLQAMLLHPVFRNADIADRLRHPDTGDALTSNRVRNEATNAADTAFVEVVEPLVADSWRAARAARSAADAGSSGGQTANAELKRKASELQKRALESERRVRRQLEFNAVRAFAMHRVLASDWTLSEFVEQTEREIWERGDLSKSSATDAATLVMATQKRPLSVLAAVHRATLQEQASLVRAARAEAERERGRAAVAEELVHELNESVRSAESDADGLRTQLRDLEKNLESEQDSRVVDKSHMVNDYEVLRTQVLRRLTSQTELLSDGLHALRAGSLEIADEFMDRALSAIQAEISRLKSVGGGGR